MCFSYVRKNHNLPHNYKFILIEKVPPPPNPWATSWAYLGLVILLTNVFKGFHEINVVLKLVIVNASKTRSARSSNGYDYYGR